jgi:hypothetical protein
LGAVYVRTSFGCTSVAGRQDAVKLAMIAQKNEERAKSFILV